MLARLGDAMARRTVEQLEARRDELTRRIREARRAEAARERSARNHALIVLGSIVESHVPGGWTAVDWDAMAMLAGQLDDAIARCSHDPLPAEQAGEELRAWERGRAARGRGGAAAADGRRP